MGRHRSDTGHATQVFDRKCENKSTPGRTHVLPTSPHFVTQSSFEITSSHLARIHQKPFIWPETIPKTSPTEDCPGGCGDESFVCEDACGPKFSGVASKATICPTDCPTASVPSGKCAFQCFDSNNDQNDDYDYNYDYGGYYGEYGNGQYGPNDFPYYGYGNAQDDGCVVEGWKVNDGQCDCPNCADEDEWNCDTCSCQGQGVCSSGINPDPLCSELFKCPSGCFVEKAWVNDGRCDCPGDCADESAWSCDNCTCGFGCGDSRGQPPCAEQFVCPGGCVISKAKVNDLVCDCPDSCADEPELDCIECFDSCPSSCGDRPPPCKFRCDDDCLISPLFVGDEYCDCPDCSEEALQGFLCNTEPGGFCECPSSCASGSVKCEPDSGSPGTPGRFICSDGCEVIPEYLDDDFCDCSDCGDEPRWTCDNCTCPTPCALDSSTCKWSLQKYSKDAAECCKSIGFLDGLGLWS